LLKEVTREGILNHQFIYEHGMVSKMLKAHGTFMNDFMTYSKGTKVLPNDSNIYKAKLIKLVNFMIA
jgi:hypothetical protein